MESLKESAFSLKRLFSVHLQFPTQRIRMHEDIFVNITLTLLRGASDSFFFLSVNNLLILSQNDPQSFSSDGCINTITAPSVGAHNCLNGLGLSFSDGP